MSKNTPDDNCIWVTVNGHKIEAEYLREQLGMARDFKWGATYQTLRNLKAHDHCLICGHDFLPDDDSLKFMFVGTRECYWFLCTYCHEHFIVSNEDPLATL